MSFQTILGQAHAVTLLRQALTSTRLGHAYLFYGPSGVGKRLAAWEFAKALACAHPTPDACDACVSCHKIATGNHPDVVSISPEGTSIRIEHIRALQQRLSYKPYESRRTVLLIDGCETFTPPAANALLKTLEEPPESALLLLVTSKKDALPLTVLSRCQQIPFRPLTPTHLRTLLVQQGVEPQLAEVVAPLAEGSLTGWLEADVSQRLAKRQEALTLLRTQGHVTGTPLLLLARQAASSREQCEAMLHWLTLLCRDLVLLKVTVVPTLYNEDLRPELMALAHTLDVAPLLDVFILLGQLQQYLAQNVNPQLTFEHLVVQLQHRLDITARQSIAP